MAHAGHPSSAPARGPRPPSPAADRGGRNADGENERRVARPRLVQRLSGAHDGAVRPGRISIGAARPGDAAHLTTGTTGHGGPLYRVVGRSAARALLHSARWTAS